MVRPRREHGEVYRLLAEYIHVDRRVHKSRHGKVFEPYHTALQSAVVAGCRRAPPLLSGIAAAVVYKRPHIHLLCKAVVHLFHDKHL